MPASWISELASEDVLRRSGTPIIIPVASIENHGALPLGTDIIFARCVLERLSIDVLALPVIPISTSIEHVGIGFTLSLSYSLFEEYISSIIRSVSSLLPSSPILVAAFHGGSLHVIANAIRALRSNGVHVHLFTPYTVIENLLLNRYAIDYRPIHADPIEASILLACCNKIPLSIEEKPLEEVLELIRMWARSGAEYRYGYWVWRDIAERYRIQRVPASQELGEELLSAVVAELEAMVRELSRIRLSAEA